MKFVNYDENMGAVEYPEGFFNVIRDLSPEEQMYYFRTTKNDDDIKINWKDRALEHTLSLEDDSNIKSVIVKDGYIVGAMMIEWFLKRSYPVLLGERICTNYTPYTSDENHPDEIGKAEYTYFICVLNK